MRRFAAIIALMSVVAVAPARDQQQHPQRLSLVQLIANPEKYDGKLVSVVGFLSFGGVDGDGLYLHKVDYDNGIDANCLAVDRTKQMLREREKLYDNYVLIVGVFRRRELPPDYVSTGTITNIQECRLWSQPDHPFAQRVKEIQPHSPH